MQTFKASTDATTIEVAQYVVNSQFGCKLLGKLISFYNKYFLS